MDDQDEVAGQKNINFNERNIAVDNSFVDLSGVKYDASNVDEDDLSVFTSNSPSQVSMQSISPNRSYSNKLAEVDVDDKYDDIDRLLVKNRYTT